MSTSNYDFAAAQAHFQAKVAFTTGVHELDVLLASDTDPASYPKTYQVVDVRYPADFEASRVPGAINLPQARFSAAGAQRSGLNKDATLYLYCYNQTCHLAALAAVALTAAGYKVIEVEGGFESYIARGYAVDESPLAMKSA